MENYSDVPIPSEAPEAPEYPVSDSDQAMDTVPSNENSVGEDSDSLWQQQLVNAEQEILKEKENGKRSIEDTGNHSDDEPSSKKRANEFEKLWSNVNENPTDFQAWTILLQHVDQVSDLESGREAYDSFFSRYPYCYGYWKKYADLEKRRGTDESILKVFNRGLESISLSVDLWIHYLEYVTTKFEDNEEYVRENFKRSIDSCGLEFRSDKLWDLYITWESNGKRWKNVTEIYEKLLATPASKYLQHWQKFQDHIKKHLPSEVVSVDEYLTLRKTVMSELNLLDGDLPDEAPPGVEAVPGDEQIGTTGDEETKVIREHIIESRRKIHDATVADAKLRWTYEDAIKRPYFHVKPLEKSQLNAWRNYLEFEIKEGNEKRVKVLFERCLIACAFYEEFWMRYIRYLEEQGTAEAELRYVYSRACKIHLRDKLRPHLAWAAFEEEKDNSNNALDILKDLQVNMDLCLEAYMMAVAVERRRGNLDAAEDIYLNCLKKFKEKENKSSYSSIAVKYARFLTFFRNDSEKAIDVINQAYEYDNANFNLLIALADNALACRPPKFDVAAQAFKSGTESSYSPTVKLMFSHRYLHFVTECATENTSMNEALRLLRKTQQEVRQAQIENEEENAKASESTSSYPKMNKQSESSVNMVPDKTQSVAASVNGAIATPHQPPQQPPNPSSPAYQNYPSQGYGYNQYQQGYNGAQYPNWGYPSQQGGGYAGYNQQGWGGYSNYYGQR